MKNAKDVPSNRWFAMTRLDENRAKVQLALKSGFHWHDVTQLAIWGNHSSTLFPDFFHARIGGKPVSDTITDNTWLETDFIKSVQQRGAAIIQARGVSSAKSAVQGVVDTVRSIIEPTPTEEWHSIALCADGSYGIEKGLISSFPRARTERSWKSCRILCSTNSAKLKSNPPSTNLRKNAPWSVISSHPEIKPSSGPKCWPAAAY